jgi:hypothetical protein
LARANAATVALSFLASGSGHWKNGAPPNFCFSAANSE